MRSRTKATSSRAMSASARSTPALSTTTPTEVCPFSRSSREDAVYVLGSFPIVREQEEARYGGRFRTRDLVLNFMAALQAGNPDAPVAG